MTDGEGSCNIIPSPSGELTGDGAFWLETYGVWPLGSAKIITNKVAAFKQRFAAHYNRFNQSIWTHLTVNLQVSGVSLALEHLVT